MIEFLIGIIVGIIVGVMVGAGVAKPIISNNIGKIKGNTAPVSANQEMYEEVTDSKKSNIFTKIGNIFKRKEKKV